MTLRVMGRRIWLDGADGCGQVLDRQFDAQSRR
jgi:hypothetical protein